MRDFLPSIGNLRRYVEPTVSEGVVRVDSGVTEGSEISIHYDPLISKLVTYGPNRLAAINAMKEALDAYVIRGLTSNANFLRSILENERFVDGRLTTGFIAEELPDGFKGHVLDSASLRSLQTAAAAL